MNLDKIFEENKQKLKNEFFCDGNFKVILNNDTIMQTPCFLLKSGSIVPKDWEILDEATMGFDGDDVKIIFENKNGQFPCLFDSENNSMLAIVPNTSIPKDIEDRINQIIIQVGNDPEVFKEIGLDFDAWTNYMNSKNNNKIKIK